MRAVIQRVRTASVTVDNNVVGKIDHGLLVLLGIGQHDDDSDIRFLADKLVGLRIFDDTNGKMNLAITDVGGAMLVVSQFTLFGDCHSGRRPSYSTAAPPELAERLYQRFVTAIAERNVAVSTGQFRAMMQVALVNDGPVTLLIDSKKQF